MSLPTTITELKERNAANGMFWFSPDTIRFFKCQIASGIIAQRYFISSEQGPSGFRRYTVRRFDERANIETIGDFQGHATIQQARAALKIEARKAGHLADLKTKAPAPYQPKTGHACGCRPGIQRDNCPQCEGTGQRIDFAAILAHVRGEDSDGD